MRNRERGSITPMVAFGAVIVTVMGVGGATIGRIVHARREAQNVADSAALGVADSIRENGKGTNRTAALRLAQRNSREPTTATIEAIDEQWKQDDTGWLFVTGHGGENVDTPRFIFAGNAQTQGRGRARVDQERRRIEDTNPADVALVLDYSGSMAEGAPTKNETLEDALTGHLRDHRIQLNYSAAFFDDTLVGEVPFGQDSIEKIIQLFQDKGPGGGTMPDIGFDKATEFFRDDTSGLKRFVVFVSDGVPNDQGAAVAGSTRMWNEARPTVMTVHIGSPEARPFMVEVSGPEDQRHNEDYYFPVADIESMRRALAQILSMIACPMEKLKKERIKDIGTIRAFLQDHNGNEAQLPLITDLSGNTDKLGFFFNEKTYDIAVTIEACALMRNEHQTLVVRYNRAVLVE